MGSHLALVLAGLENCAGLGEKDDRGLFELGSSWHLNGFDMILPLFLWEFFLGVHDSPYKYVYMYVCRYVYIYIICIQYVLIYSIIFIVYSQKLTYAEKMKSTVALYMARGANGSDFSEFVGGSLRSHVRVCC